MDQIGGGIEVSEFVVLHARDVCEVYNTSSKYCLFERIKLF